MRRDYMIKRYLKVRQLLKSDEFLIIYHHKHFSLTDSPIFFFFNDFITINTSSQLRSVSSS